MYYYIKGKVVHRDEESIAVEAGGVAYYIKTTLSSLAKFGNTGDMATVYTYLNVREDAMDLYGFAGREEKKMFLMLTSVSGVGPKAAISILSVASSEQVAAAIASGDQKMLTRASGVGPKAAQRIILELKDKVGAADIGLGGENTVSPPASNSRHEAISALVALGYSLNDAKAAVESVDGDMDVEEIIKKALMSF